MQEKAIFERSDRLKELREQKKQKEEETKALSAQIETVERELVELMVDEEMSSFKRNGNMFSLVVREYPSAVAEHKDELYKRLKEHGFEDLFTVNAQTLSATIKEEMGKCEGQVPEWLNGLIKFAEKTSVRIIKG